MTKVPEKRADPCCECGGDHVEGNCMYDPDYISAFTDAVYEYIRDKKMFEADSKQEKLDTISLLKGFRRSDVDEV